MHWLLLLILIPYICQLLKIFRGLKKIKVYEAENDPGIFISVIVACRNEEKNLPNLLSDIAVQDYDQSSFEMIVADDNSSDSTWEIASGFKGIKNLLTVRNKGKGKKQALQTAIEASKGILIITTDADCRAGRKWLSTIASYYTDYHAQMIICPVRLISRPGFFNKFQELEFLSLQGITAGAAVSGEPVMCNGANLAFCREVYLRHSGRLHPEINSGDDIFLLHSIKAEPGNVVKWLESERVIVSTNGSSGILSFLKQRARWISKAKYYRDSSTIILSVVTFVTNLLLLVLFIGSFYNVMLFKVLIGGLVLKSVPDFLILSDTSRRYGNKQIMRWFLPSQIIYPFYVITVAFVSFLRFRRMNN